MSFENELSQKSHETDKLDIGLLKFFWQTNPFLKSNKKTIPTFLKKMEVLKNFSDLELLDLAKFLHRRTFDRGEVIFSESDQGVGFYFIVSGGVDIIVEKSSTLNNRVKELDSKSQIIVSLERNDYFGELALLQDRHIRNATAVAKEPCELLAIFKPDLDILINEKPVVAAKLLQSISLIVANRLYSVTQEVRKLKKRCRKLEIANENKK